ncbi:COG4315 family predicted lipoprotein [Streptomyces brasiliensis]|uniref:Lipoprotein n=1 Tax=Streptomyces brasiliensis TaxID=1954 RepID=A0A917KBY8_9ACTN|nr:hypothetical protein [Streptomyces brasiliensis]GGJ08601.1 hypothetical protein GCM10010121_018660 [Streptomyces brasiliensis]
MNTARIAVAAVALAALGLAGCGAGGGDDSGSGNGSQGSGKATAAMDPSTVRVSQSSLGNILVDGSGRTLYLFTGDGTNTNSMKCNADCLKLWPPVKSTPKAGAGADAHLIGRTKSGSGSQATYAGHPLYYYADDRSAGDLKGQGMDKIWFVLDPHGKAITKSVASTQDTGGSGGYGY